MWLLDGEQEDDEDQEDEIFRDDESLDEDDLADEETPSDFAPIDLETATSVKHILNCWPNKTVEVARAVGVTAKELKWYVGGRAPLDRTKLSDLLSLVGLEYDSSSDFYQSCGPCVLIAFSPRSIVEAYTSLAHGGDLEFSFEVLPSLIPADPSWRYMLFRACGDMINIIMLPRGGKVAENLNRDSFINFGGSVNVPDNIYRNLVATCGRACKSPLANRHEVERFYRENLEFFDTLEEKYRHR